TREPRGSIEQEVEEGLESLLARSTGEIISESVSCGPVDLRQGLQKRGNALGELETVARRQREQAAHTRAREMDQARPIGVRRARFPRRIDCLLRGGAKNACFE